MITKHSDSVELHMRNFYELLSEKDGRRYAAVEAEKLGYGGVMYIAELFGCDSKTIQRGAANVDILPADDADSRVRKKGGTQKC